jgi:zinc and cadmium transporter
MAYDLAYRTGLAAGLGLVAAAGNLLGGYFVVRREWPRIFLQYFLALGAGYMLAVAFLDLIPESIRLAGDSALIFVLLGYFLIHLFEHTIAPHFHFGEETHLTADEERHTDHEGHSHAGHDHTEAEENGRRGRRRYGHGEGWSRYVSRTVLLGLVIHTFFDGVAIAAGFLVSVWLGAMIFVAVFLHKLPEGFTVASVVLASGQSKRNAILAAGLLGAATLFGVLLTSALQGQLKYALPISGGVTVYVAATDLLPEVNREPSWKMALLVFFGVAIVLIIQRLFHV